MGWNARDPLAHMMPHYATIMDNYFPESGHVESRKGSKVHATGAGTTVQTLFAYRGGATKSLLAVSDGSIYDVTDAGAVGTALDTELASSKWQGVNFNGRGILVSGSDPVKSYDGTDITDAAFSGAGLTVDNLIQVLPFKNRLLFIEKDTATIWYGGLNSITGTLEPFHLNRVHPLGGKAVALGTMTVDGGDGVDDILVICMDSGDVLLYSGTDVDTDFAIVGIYHIGRVIGERPLLQLGGDLIAITSDGYIPMLQFLKQGRSRADLALSTNISGAINRAVGRYKDRFGWQGILYSDAKWLLFNVPSAPAVQHVMNTQTQAWCRFRGMDAQCWEVLDDKLYFGGFGGKVYLANTGQNDAGAPIVGDVQQAYNYFGAPGRKKHFWLYQPVLGVDGKVAISVGFGVDFNPHVSVEEQELPDLEGAYWGPARTSGLKVGKWNTFPWVGGLQINDDWRSPDVSGNAAAMRLRTETVHNSVEWYATNILYEMGSVL